MSNKKRPLWVTFSSLVLLTFAITLFGSKMLLTTDEPSITGKQVSELEFSQPSSILEPYCNALAPLTRGFALGGAVDSTIILYYGGHANFSTGNITIFDSGDDMIPKTSDDKGFNLLYTTQDNIIDSVSYSGRFIVWRETQPSTQVTQIKYFDLGNDGRYKTSDDDSQIRVVEVGSASSELFGPWISEHSTMISWINKSGDSYTPSYCSAILPSGTGSCLQKKPIKLPVAPQTVRTLRGNDGPGFVLETVSSSFPFNAQLFEWSPINSYTLVFDESNHLYSIAPFYIFSSSKSTAKDFYLSSFASGGKVKIKASPRKGFYHDPAFSLAGNPTPRGTNLVLYSYSPTGPFGYDSYVGSIGTGGHVKIPGSSTLYFSRTEIYTDRETDFTIAYLQDAPIIHYTQCFNF